MKKGINDIDVTKLKEEMIMACEKSVKELISVARQPIVTQYRQEGIIVALNRIIDYVENALEKGDDSESTKEKVADALEVLKGKADEIATVQALGSDKLKNAVVAKKLSMKDGFEIMSTIEYERQLIQDMKDGKSQRGASTGLAERNARQTL